MSISEELQKNLISDIIKIIKSYVTNFNDYELIIILDSKNILNELKKHNCKDLEKYNDSRFLINICFQNSFISDNLLYVLYYILIDEDDDEGFWTDFSGLKMCAIDMSDFIIMHIAYVQSFYSPTPKNIIDCKKSIDNIEEIYQRTNLISTRKKLRNVSIRDNTLVLLNFNTIKIYRKI